MRTDLADQKTTNRKRGKRSIGALLVLGLAALIIYGFIPEPIPVEIAKPVIGSLSITVDDDGETRIREPYVLSAPVSGKMLRVALEAGDLVVANETVVATIQPSDPSLLDARMVAEANARVRVAEASEDQAVTVVQRATQALELAQQDYQRAESLLKRNAISKSEFDATENRLKLAIADLRSAESAQRVARYEIDQAEAALRYLKSDFDFEDDNLFKVIAPSGGKVLEVYREDSGVIASGTPIVRIGDAADLELVIDVLSTDAVKVRPGDDVRIDHWGGDHPLAAIVRLVEPSAFLKVSALGVEEKRVNVIADFVDPLEQRETLGDGFRIEASIVVQQTDRESMKIPTATLFRQREDWFVYRIVDGRAERTKVEIGLSNGLETKIKSGLDAEDKLIIHPDERIQPGVRVKMEAETVK